MKGTIQALGEQVDNLRLQAQAATARVASEERLARTAEEALTQEKHRASELAEKLQASQADLSGIRAVVEKLEAAARDSAGSLAEAQEAVGKADHKLGETQERLRDTERRQGVHLLARYKHRKGMHEVQKYLNGLP